jgi:preprotein translocase subunit SecE
MIEPIKKVLISALIVVVIIGFMVAIMGGMEWIADWF